MNLNIEPSVMERVVFEAARRDGRHSGQYHREFAACFEEGDADRRDLAFRALHDAWFERLGFRGNLTALIAEFPHISSKVARLTIVNAGSRKRQGMELFGVPGRYALVAGIDIVLLLREADFADWARHELLHIDDMLDPAFGFDPSERPTGATSAVENLVRDRYAVLWAASIDARLSTRREGSLQEQKPGADALGSCALHRRRELARAFNLDDAAAAGAFDRLWADFQHHRPTHQILLEWARHGIPGLSEPASSRHTLTPPAGSLCPLCRFPTFDWADPREAAARVSRLVCKDFPQWAPTDGICGRCFELYVGRKQTEVIAV